MLVTEDGMVTDIRPEHPQKAPCARTGGGEQPASKLERVSPPSSRRRTRLAVRGHVGLLRAPPPVAQARDHVAAERRATKRRAAERWLFHAVAALPLQYPAFSHLCLQQTLLTNFSNPAVVNHN